MQKNHLLWWFFLLGADNHKGHGKTQYLCGFAANSNVYIFLTVIALKGRL